MSVQTKPRQRAWDIGQKLVDKFVGQARAHDLTPQQKTILQYIARDLVVDLRRLSRRQRRKRK